MYTFGETLSSADASTLQDTVNNSEPKPDFGYDELIKALTGQENNNLADHDALTNRQLQELTGRNGRYVLARITELIELGKVKCVQVKRRSRATGNLVTVYAYKWIGKEAQNGTEANPQGKD